MTHVITIGEDVTEWREAQDRFAQAEKLAAIGTLAAGVMHEINNPLATIAACAESRSSSREQRALPEVLDGLRLIQSEVHRCKGIVDSLLDFSRPKASEKSLVNVNEAIERTLFVLQASHAVQAAHRARASSTRRSATSCYANNEQLVQVFMALLINAMDAMNDRGTVTLRTRWATRRAFGHRGDHRPGRGHPARRPAEDLRAVLHDQAARSRHRPRALDLLRHRRRARRPHRGGQRRRVQGSAFRIILPRADDSGVRA